MTAQDLHDTDHHLDLRHHAGGEHGGGDHRHTDSADAGRSRHGGHGAHAGHHVEMFRRRFWISLALTVPIVVTSHMVMDWFGYELDFAGMEWVGPILGSVVFFWGGWPFLEGGWREAKERQPGM